MNQIILQLALYTFVILSCLNGHEDKKDFSATIKPAADRSSVYFPLLQEKKLGLVVNHTSRIGGEHLVDSLVAAGFDVSKIFAPEHGFRGTRSAGESIEDQTDSQTGIPVISLYGSKKKPDAEDLAGVEMLVFDIQDVGVRFYTYISTLHYVMETAAENDIPLIVLDRPNPNRHIIDGPLMEDEYKSFVGLHPVPVAYGMTIGEYARMINGEGWLAGGMQCQLTVIDCENYSSGSRYILPIPPSPNLPNSQSVGLYPSLCFFEGTTISVGRGTEFPFQVLGHPELNMYDFEFTPRSLEGAKYPKHQDKLCYGLDLRKAELPDSGLDLGYLILLYKSAGEANISFFNEGNFFEKLAGTRRLREMIMAGFSEEQIKGSWQHDLAEFKKTRQKYIVYSE